MRLPIVISLLAWAVAANLANIALALSGAATTPAPDACLSDALRYCIRAAGDGTATRDHAGIEACLVAHKALLSRACRETVK